MNVNETIEYECMHFILSDIIKFLLMLLLHLKFLSIVLTSYKYWQNNITVFNHFLTKIQAIDCAYEGSVWWVLSRGKLRARLQATQDSLCSCTIAPLDLA